MPTVLNDPAMRVYAQAWADNPDLYTEVNSCQCQLCRSAIRQDMHCHTGHTW